MSGKFSFFQRGRFRQKRSETMKSTDSRDEKRPRQSDCDCDKAAARKLIRAHDSEIELRRNGDEDGDGDGDGDAQGLPPSGLGAEDGTFGLPLNTDTTGAGSQSQRSIIPSVAEYDEVRRMVVSRENELSFDARYRSRANDKERRVDDIIQKMRKQDEAFFSKLPSRKGYQGQLHPRFAGDHFLSNADLIDKTGLFKIASMMPKGAHLHIHFNACLPPNVLLDIAKDMERMFITSNLPLICKGEGEDKYENFDKCEMQFSIMRPDKEDPGNLFSADYQPRQTMRFAEFRKNFSKYYTKADADINGKAKVDTWLLNKLLFQEQEAHNLLQTASG
jgi:adenosine deaminase CECR1